MPFDGLGRHGDFFGIDVDSANDLARRLGTRADYVTAGYDSLYDVLRVGQAEAAISAMPIEPGKLGLWAYSQSYFEAGQVMVINPPRYVETSEVSLAVEYGSDADAAARYLTRRRAGVEIKYTASAADALKAVNSGWADAAIVDGISAKQLLPTFPELQIAEQVTSDPYGIAVWGESTQLLEAINAGLAEMKQDGTLQRIVAEWMKK
jgi:polar amino acid transport system substrate-binding protein